MNGMIFSVGFDIVVNVHYFKPIHSCIMTHSNLNFVKTIPIFAMSPNLSLKFLCISYQT